MLFQHTVFNMKICNLVCVLDTSASLKWFNFILYQETIFFFNSPNETCVYIRPVYNLPESLGKASAISLLGDMFLVSADQGPLSTACMGLYLSGGTHVWFCPTVLAILLED